MYIYFWCQQFWEISEMEIFLTEWSFPLQTPGRQVKPDLRLLESLECVITSGQLGLKFSLMDNSIVPNRHNSWSPRQTRRHIGNCEDSVSDNRRAVTYDCGEDWSKGRILLKSTALELNTMSCNVGATKNYRIIELWNYGIWNYGIMECSTPP